MSKTVLLDFVHHKNYKIKRVESWNLFSPSGKKGGKGQKSSLLGLMFELSSDL